MRLPAVLFAEGGGGRPGDTDYPVVSALETRAFALWARLSGLVPRIAIVAGRCFAGNAVLAGCSDLIVATEGSSLGMGGPAMIEGGGLGKVDPDEVGPLETQARNGVVDVVAADEAEATAVAKRLLGYFQGATPPGEEPDQTALRDDGPGAGAPRLRGRAGDRDARRRRLGHLPARALRAGAGDGAGADRGPAARLHRQRLAPHGRRADQRRLRQGGPLPLALRRLRPAGRLAARHAGLHGRAGGRGDRAGAPRLAAAGRRARRCGCR